MFLMREIVLIAHDIRSAHNVGALLRTADGFGVAKVFFTGYTPYPSHDNDSRMPHIAAKLDKQIQKTALGAQRSVNWEHHADVLSVLDELKNDGFNVVALEQAPDAIPLPALVPPKRVAILLGREVEGIEPNLVSKCDVVVEIPMQGKKESFNVVEAATCAMYQLRFAM